MNRTNWGYLGVVVTALIFSSLPAAAKDDCYDLKGDAGIGLQHQYKFRKIQGMSEQLTSTTEGLKYRRDKGDSHHAIADYNQAISIDPKYVSAYNNRGVAYRKGRDRPLSPTTTRRSASIPNTPMPTPAVALHRQGRLRPRHR